jgi:long-chain acyl-CoA synthetase
MSIEVLPTLKQARVYLRRWGIQRTPTAIAGLYPWEHSYPAGVSWRLAANPRPLYSILDDAVAVYPKKVCLNFQGKKYSYQEIGKLVCRVAKGLQKLGVRRGTKVGLFLPNSPYFVICYYAVLKTGGTVVNFHPLYAEREIARQIEDSETSIMITLDLRSFYPKIANRLNDTRLKRIVVCRMNDALSFPRNHLFRWFRRSEVAEIPTDDRHVMFDALIRNGPDFELAAVDPEHDIAVLQYTGGVTGTPKGAMLTHANLYMNTLQLKTWATDVTLGKEKCLAVLPLFHTFGMTGIMNFGLAIGAELVLLPRFHVGEALSAISRHRCTLLFGVPTIYSALGTYGERRKFDLSSLKFCLSGGAPLSAEIQDAFKRFAGCAVIDGYGLTEASPACSLHPARGPNKAGSVGLPLPGTIIEIVSLADSKRILKAGELGEICIRGPQVMAGYWKQPKETAAVLHRGRLHTGDFGYLDCDGYLFIVDRIKEMIISGGFNVYPRTVEEALTLHPAVAQAVVYGVPDQHRGERVKAYVKLLPSVRISAPELRAFLRDKLAPFEMPSEIEFLDEIPAELLHRQPRKDLLSQKFGIEALLPKIVRRLRGFWPSGGRRGAAAPKLKPLFPEIHDRARA